MKNMHLVPHLKWESIPNRKGFGIGLVKAGDMNENVVAICADLTGSVQISPFAEKYPERFVQVGVAEQNLATVASGMARMGKIPFAASYAAFNPGRNWEQIKTTAALNDVPVKIVGAHAGLITGPDGATHQMLEDIAMMRAMPNMVVVVPGDSIEAEKATIALAQDKRPGYIRLARDATPVITTHETPFVLGKAYVYSPGQDITLVSTGIMTPIALEAAENLFKDGIDVEVIHCPTIKPLDAATILTSAKKTRKVITLEEAQINGGLGGAVAELLSEELPTPLRRMGVRDEYGQSGTPDKLFHHYGLSTKHVMMTAHDLIQQFS
jgi:transketolase